MGNSKADIYTNIEEQSRKINFLNNLITQIKEDSILSSGLESDFIDHGLTDLFDIIRHASTEVVLKIIQERLADEEKIFKNLTKQLNEH